jgi:hypothetical protein
MVSPAVIGSTLHPLYGTKCQLGWGRASILKQKIKDKSYNRRNGFGKERNGLFSTACFVNITGR